MPFTMWQDESGHVRLVGIEWRFEKDYLLSHLGTQKEWCKWFVKVIGEAVKEGRVDYYDDMIERPIEEPILIFEDGPKAELLDGNHRTGASFFKGCKTIRAIVGRRSKQLERREAT